MKVVLLFYVLKYSRSLIIFQLNYIEGMWSIFRMFLALLWYLEVKGAFRFHLNYLNVCSQDKLWSQGFATP